MSFGEEDRHLKEWFKQMLSALEFDVITADVPQARPPLEKVEEMLANSQAVLAVVTRREKIEGTDAWTVPGWVQNELGMAHVQNKTIAIFREKGVVLDGLGPLITEYEPFDRDALSESAPRIVRYLADLRNRARPGMSSPATWVRLALSRGTWGKP